MPEQNSPIPFEARLAAYAGQEVVDITDGFDEYVQTADEFIGFLTSQLEAGRGRVPILVFKPKAGEVKKKILMVGGSSDKNAHEAILGEELSENDVFCSASIEGGRSEPPIVGPYLTLDTKQFGKRYVEIGIASDLNVGRLSANGGKEILQTAFGKIAGVSVVVPNTWE